MRSRRNLARAALAALVFAFGAGVLQLFQLGFDSGSVYPPYSTLRADPLGAKALFDSLALLPGMNVVRNASALAELPAGRATLFFLGADRALGAKDRMAVEWERQARAGARVVIAFPPEWPGVEARHEEERPRAKLFLDSVGVAARRSHAKATDQEIIARTGAIPRKTALYFDTLAPEWQVRRKIEDRAVLIERPWHAGSLVAIADSWGVSNEALSKGPDTRELVWLVGPNRTLIFDETHLGIEETGSVAGLMRRYRLHGLVLALLGLMALYIWSRSIPFLPAMRAERNDFVVAGRSSSAGLVGLLQRTVPPAKLIDACLEEWRATPSARMATVREAVDRTARENEKDPVRRYGQLRQTVQRFTQPWKQASNN